MALQLGQCPCHQQKTIDSYSWYFTVIVLRNLNKVAQEGPMDPSVSQFTIFDNFLGML